MSEEKKEAGKAENFSISRTFDAPRELVFGAWTEARHLSNWFGPSGCKLTVERLELKPGGVCLFSMRIPNAGEMWGRWRFLEIASPAKLVWVHSFSNREGEPARHPFDSNWPMELLTTTTFQEFNDKTTVTVHWVPINPTPAEIEAFKKGLKGATQGWTGTFNQLESYLAGLK